MQDLNSITALTGQPAKLTAGDESHELYPLNGDRLAKLQKWVDEQFPNPFDVVAEEVERRTYNTAQHQFLLKTAIELQARGRKLIGTPEADALLMSSAGFTELLFVCIQPGEPEFTRDDARRFYHALNATRLAQVVSATNADMVVSDPKAETATTT
jgi:hypothetical protein